MSDVRGFGSKAKTHISELSRGAGPKASIELSLKLVVWVFFGLEKEAAVHAFVAPGVDEHVPDNRRKVLGGVFRRQKLLFASFFF